MSISSIEAPDLIKTAWCTDSDLVVALKDGRRVSVPLWWYPRLRDASRKRRARFEIGRFGLRWEELDEDIELAGFLVGAKAPNAVPPREKTEAAE